MNDGTKIVVDEKQIDEKLYNSLLEFRDLKYETIRKMRYYFSYKGEYFNLDVFEDGQDIGILEINIVSVLEKVSNNELYFNKNIAKRNSKKQEKKA